LMAEMTPDIKREASTWFQDEGLGEINSRGYQQPFAKERNVGKRCFKVDIRRRCGKSQRQDRFSSFYWGRLVAVSRSGYLLKSPRQCCLK
jgi:hypothetical protein